MVDVLTPTIRLTEPTIGGDTTPIWPTLLNNNMVYTDQATNQVVNITMPDTNVTLVADGTSSDQARYLMYSFIGALTADRSANLPPNQKFGYAINGTSGGKNVILRTGLGNSINAIPGWWTPFWCDGTNVFTLPVAFGSVSIASDGGFYLNKVLGKNTLNFAPSNFIQYDGAGNLHIAATNSIQIDATEAVTGNLSSSGTIFGVQLSISASGFFTGNVTCNQLFQTSDYRLKVTFGEVNTGHLFDAVQVHDAAFKTEPEIRRPMFLAHEVQLAMPWAVQGAKDATDITGVPVPQAVDLISLVPVLWAEIRSLRERVATLERGEVPF